MAFIDCINSLKEPDKKFAVQNELFKIAAHEEALRAEKYDLFTIVRNEESSIEKTLKILEKHFGLSG